ncbi:MFS transporter [Pseudonocardia asaccharolytica]|uniref:MFS transporter n=1 Tax=Pseudonocardia asaccharolytica DSM 44247 = NBRC 16224 TaxID=1123024 RepID=A0A511D2R0_9PSEU|nr:MFS transporter [Pseudonocardia asaccharolytica]GEL19076.1 MFS transporter [Pseudonocardia asaccharolytica DSM 44247 = NBRC 16224]
MLRRWSAPAALWAVVFVVAYGTNVPTPLLLIYQDLLGLSPTQLTSAFGVYAAGLVPALLLAGPASDRFGRKPVVVPFVVLAALTSLLFLGAASSTFVLFAGRFLQGAVSGVVFSIGTAWLGELVGTHPAAAARSARLTTAALGGGWAVGPLVTGLLAQWAPWPTVLPFAVHVALMLVGLALLPIIPETLPRQRRRLGGPLVHLGVPAAARWPFVLVVAPIAVAVFTFPSTAVTVLPLQLVPAMPGIAVAVTGIVSGITLGTGVIAQPLVRRLGATLAGPVGVAVGAGGLGLSLLADALGSWPLLVPVSVLLGVAYGLCLAAGLTLTAQIASPTARGALTGTFYACAYLGFGAPVLLSLARGANGFAGALAGLAVIAAVVATLLLTPAARRLVTPQPADLRERRALRPDRT